MTRRRGARDTRTAVLALLALVVAGLATWALAAPAVAAPCDAPVVSPVACENTKPGSPESEWGITGAGSSSIQGFATDISVDQGGTVGFKVDTVATSYRLDIYRMGYYAGAGARKVATVLPTVLNSQPNCVTAPATGLVDCGNWTQNASWAVPADSVSGVYFARLVRTDGTAGASHVFFVVRDDDGGSELLFQTSDTTWQAYNAYGGNSLYTGAPAGRAYKVSYNRPFTTRANAPEDWVFNAEYPMVRFLESNGYDVSYTTGIDSHRRGGELTEHQTFLSVGHDEYWSGQQRANVEAARAAGVNLAFFSGNEVFWKTRWENSIDGSGTPNRTLVTYKETHADAVIDPAAPTWTGTWRDPRFSPPGDGGRPENALTGQIFTINCCAINMSVGSADGRMRFWRNTRVANLTGSQTTTIGTNVIGYEWDEDLDNGHRPAGTFRLSQTQGSGERITDHGSSYSQGPATHSMTMYRHASGALVFGAGTIQWAWGLDSQHDRGTAAADVAAQQATVNLLADMGSQPTTLRPGLSVATASTDTVAPTSTITSPAANATVPVGTPLTVSGTAADTGGRVGGVEVSTDNGATWHRATGRETWTYSYTPSANGATTLRVRATDDSANTQSPGPGTPITVGNGPATCPCTIWPGTATPERTDSDTAAVELGVKFRTSTAGFVTGIRYYKPSVSTGTHVGTLWTGAGTKLGTVTFTNETASGWQQATFASPVAVTANTTYVASYFTPSRYVASSDYFATATTRGPLTALANGTDGGNGLYRYGGTPGVFPTSSYNSENYWVDVVFADTDTTKPTVTSRTPAPGATGVSVGVSPTAELSEPVQQSTIGFELRGPGGGLVPAATSYDAGTRTATLDPAAALAPATTYTASLAGARDSAGNTMDPVTWTFTTETADTTKPTVTGRTPAPGATGVSVGTSASAVFSEAVQQASISMELRNAANAVVPSTTSYNATTRTVTLNPNAPLAASTTFTVNLTGAQDAAGNTMDPVTWTFTTEAADTTKPTVTGRTPAPGATGVPVTGTVTATFSEPVQQASIALELRTPANALVPATTSYNATTRTATLTPTAALNGATTYTASLGGARDPSGNLMDPVTWSFTTVASTNGCPCTIWPATATPARTDSDRDAVELGVKFRTNTDGFVTGIRFYKAVESTGTHTGSLWTSAGARLAGVTFTNETASGWQQATFTSPVAVTAGTTYVASYHTPSRYVVTSSYFTAPTTRGPLTALQDGVDGGNGLYRYSATAGVFPNQTFKSENYWVDVVFADTDTVKPTVVGRTPAPGAMSVPLGTTATAAFDEPVDPGSITFELRSPTGAVVTSTTTYNAGTRTATLTPSTALAPSTTYTATLGGARDPSGNVMSTLTWTFTTETPDSTKPTATGRTPAPGATGVPVSSTVTATFSEAVQQSTISLELRTPANALVPATTTYNATTRTVTLTPTSALSPSTTYTANLSGARDVSGNLMDPVSWTFATEAADSSKPTVTGRSPAVGATGVPVSTTATATFSETVQQATVTFELRTPANALVPATTTYNATTRTVTLTPNAPLALGTTYTANLTGARDTAGNQMDPVSWTFTTTASTSNCPCSIWPSSAVPDRTDADTSAVELGVRFRASTNGFITGIRFYKPAVSTGTHVGSLWTSAGVRLGSVTFTNETASGWQQATFPSPIQVSADTTYVASYFTPSRYAASSAYFAAAATTRGPLTALRDGTDGGNGLYRYTGTPGAFPNSTYGSENYWVDVVFAETAVDDQAPTVSARTPAPGSAGVPASVRPSASFSETVTPASISMVLRNTATSAAVAATTGYDAGTQTATLTPTSPLAYSTGYTVSLSGARDAAGNTMAPVSWTFETSAPPPPGIDAGPGGPIALVTSDANRSSSYLAEIARAEGLNEFATIKNTDLSAASLAAYSVVVLGDVAITDAHVTALTAWVNSGGNLVLMRPDPRLLPLAGLTAQAGTVANGYLRVDAATEPGAGITTETMQFHGTANRYALSGATSVAELFTTATAGTGQPAVAWRSVGSSGGQVATFAYDLAQSVIWTRQGNPAWAGTNRDTLLPNRSNDQFFGGASTDWVNLAKVAIPQADEQQRLLANLATVMVRDRLPLPRFWYFPSTHKAVLVATGDDHANGGTQGRMSTYNAASPAGCTVSRWECPRFSSYVFPGSPLTNGQASTFTSQGFEVGLHPQNGCTNYTSLANLQDTYTAQLAEWKAKYTAVPAPTTSRYHCIVWSDWASQPKAQLAAGIRLDTNYYYFPGSWVADRPGFMTGSGMPMRFTDTDGSLIDVFQAATQMTDESEQSYPFTPDTLLDRALGPLGYYGAFTANLHTDNATTFEDTQVLASAQERGVPVITAKQLLTWVDGRNASSYSNTSWSGSTLTFTVNVGAGASQLTGMVPTTGPGGRTLTTLSRSGLAVPYSLMTVKGQQYAVFAASSGGHVAEYADGGSAAIAGARTTEVSSDTATLAWQTDAPASSTVLLGSTPQSLSPSATVAELTGRHLVSLDGLAAGRRYHYRLRSTAADGSVAVWPAPGAAPASFTTRGPDSRAPRIGDVRAFALPDGTARITWTTDEPATSVVRFGRSRLGTLRRDDELTRRHEVVLTGLAARRSYGFRVESLDADGNTRRAAVRRLRAAGAGVAVQTLEEFRTGTMSPGLTLDPRGFGSLTLAGRGRASYTSTVVDAHQKVDWRRAVLRGRLPAGTRATVTIRTGSTSTPGASWSTWSSPRDHGDRLKQSGRYLQYRIALVATGSAVPSVAAVGFTHSGRSTEVTEHDR
ncbi:DUF4082 domain-containing protein [Nocardioides sp. LHG3406-4]|uniref:DUF4082 domain-containing protein n=1 Tax=Nocardioides sp. LHG3406-4 TaxID=2804575 RepID=UPI003CF0AAC3